MAESAPSNQHQETDLEEGRSRSIPYLTPSSRTSSGPTSPSRSLEVTLWECSSKQTALGCSYGQAKASPHPTCLNTSIALALPSWPGERCRIRGMLEPQDAQGATQPCLRSPRVPAAAIDFPGWGMAGLAPRQRRPDYSHFPARSPSPLSASCLRLLPGFTRAISKRSLEIDFYHLVINIVYGDITAGSSHEEEGGEAGRQTPACSPQLHGALARALLVPVPVPTGSDGTKP